MSNNAQKLESLSLEERRKLLQRNEPPQPSKTCTKLEQRMYFLQDLHPRSNAYTLYPCFEIKGPLDIKQLKHSINQLVLRHPNLRCSFQKSGPHLRKVIHEQAHVNI